MKKFFKASVSVIFCLCLVFTSMLPAFAAVAQVKKLKVSAVTQTSATLQWSKVSGATGYEVEQYISKKWKKIATSSKTTYTVKKLKIGSSYKFRVRAYKKSGKSVTYGSYSSAVTAKPAPSKVAGLKLTAVSATTATLKWTKQSGVNGYRIQQLVNKKWVTVVKSTTKNTAKITLLVPGTKNSFRVSAFKKVSSKTYYGENSDVLVAKTSKLTAPKSLKASSITETGAKISWKKVSGATSYVVYSIVGDTQKIVARSSKNSCSITNLNASTEYIFSVRACTTVGKKNYYSSFSDNISVKTSPAKVTKLTAKPKDTQVDLSWKASVGADGYEIYQYDLKTNKWSYIGSTETNSYTVIDLTSLTEYTFKVRAYHTATSQKVFGSYSDEIKVLTLAAPVSNLKLVTVSDSSVTLSWTAVSKASSYKIEMSTDESKWTTVNEKQIVAGGKVSVTVNALNESTDYFFRVSCIVSAVAGVPANITIRTAPGKVTSVVANDLRKTVDPLTGKPAGKITLEWSGVKGAMGYEISKYDKTNGWKVIGAQDSTVFSATELSDDIEYSFKIRAYYTMNKVNYYGPYSDIISAKELPAQITGVLVDQIGTDSVTVKWDANPKAEKYVLRLSENNGPYQQVKVNPTTEGTRLYAKLGSLKAGVIYSVSVCAAIGSEESFPSSVSFKTVPGKTEKLVATAANDTSVTLAWDSVTGAEGYEIEQLDSGTNQYIKIESVSAVTYVVSRLIPSNKYNFRVRAYNECNGNIQYGAYSEIVTATTVSASVNTLEATNITQTSVSLAWATLPGASYKVEKSKNGGTYEAVSSTAITVGTTTATAVIAGLDSATRYTFRVCAVNGTVEGAWNTISVKTAPYAPVNFVATATAQDSISTSWASVTGADGYELSIKSGSGEWKVLGTTLNDYYDVENLSAETSYTLKVRAYTTLNSIVTYSPFSNEVTEKTNAASVKITGFTATTKSDSSIELSWNTVAGASYKIEKSENNSVYSNVTDSPIIAGTKTTVLVTGLTSGTKYFFRVYSTVNGNTEISDIVNATTTGKATVADISNLSVTSSASGSTVSMKLTWTAFSGASYYLVKCDNPSMSYKTTSPLYTISSGITSGKNYTFYVEAYNTSNTMVAKSASKSCTAASASSNPSTPSNKPVSGITIQNNTDGKSYTLSWDNIDGAVYSVERWNESNSAWEQVPGYKYSARISAEASDKSMNVTYNKKSDFVSTISWTAVSGISNYAVQSELSSGSEEWKTEMSTSSISVDLRLPPQSKQHIRVSAISDVKFRIRALNATDESIELASSEYTAKTFLSYGDVTFTTPSVSFSNSDEAKEAYTLMLVQAINNTKLERSKVNMTATKKLNAEIDNNSVSVNGLPLGLLINLYPELRKEFESMSNDMSENSVTTCTFEYGYGRGTVKTTDTDGTENVKTKTLYLHNFVEPENGFAYLYDQHNISSFSKGISSISATSTGDGGYNITLKLKDEKATATTDANYHKGFTENFAVNSKSLSEFGGDSKGTVSGTTITAKVNKDYTLDSIRIAGKFGVSLDVKDSGMSLKAAFDGNVDSLYTFSR